MITILNQTTKFLRITLSRGKVLRLGPRKEGQLSTNNAECESVKQLVADGVLRVMNEGSQAGATTAVNPGQRANVQGHQRVAVGQRGDR
jgi:hypothetical protein